MTLDTNNNPWVPVGGLLLLVSALGAYFYLGRPLESRRPPEFSAQLTTTTQHEVVRARLWQDPLHAMHMHWDSLRMRNTTSLWNAQRYPPTIGAFAESFATLRMKHDYEGDLVLFVTMPGSPYANDREGRRRQRHAVVSALTSQGFVPTDADHLGYFVAPSFTGRLPEGNLQPVRDSILVGYEHFQVDREQAAAGKWNTVLVLWANAGDFATHPINQVSALLAAIDSAPAGSRMPTAVLLGPVGSGALQAMLDEPPVVSDSARNFLRSVKSYPHSFDVLVEPKVLQDVDIDGLHTLEAQAVAYRSAMQVLSVRATAPVDWLVCDRRERSAGCGDLYQVGNRTNRTNVGADQSVRKALGVGWFRSLVARDDQVLTQIMRELVDRGACERANNEPSIAIITEQDTVYGRLFDDMLREVASHVLADRKEELGKCKMDVVDVGYLRGVDGEIPPAFSQAQREADRSGLNGRPIVDVNQLSLFFGIRRAPSFGVAQLDYVQRLAERLRDAMRTPGGAGTLVAIGLFGSNIYDKLLILQAMREQFPNVTFFTTDLDVRLLDHDVRPWTRNTIVGSAYGLTLGEGNETTFRDSYQTALFRGVTVSLDLPVDPASAAVWRDAAVEETVTMPSYVWQHDAPRPQVFEVGLKDFVRIGRDVPATLVDVREGLLVLSPLLLLAAFAFAMAQRMTSASAATRRSLYTFVLVGSVCASLTLGVYMSCLTAREALPFFEGVSAVPTVILQATAILFAVCMVVLAYGRTAQAQKYLAETLAIDTESFETVGGASNRESGTAETRQFGRRLPVRLVATWRASLDVEGGEKRAAPDLWRSLLEYGGQRRCFQRTGLRVVGTYILLYVLMGDVGQEQALVSYWHATLDAPAWRIALGGSVLFAGFYCRDALSVWQVVVGELARIGRFQGDAQGRFQCRALIGGIRARMDNIVRCTELVEPLIVLPLLPMVVLMLSRSTMFEGWHWPWQISVFYVGFVVYVLVAGFRFQGEARRAQESFVEQLREARTGAGQEEAAKLESAIEWVQERREGAFVPWTQHPIFQSFAVPLGSIVAIALLETWLRGLS